MVVKFGFTSMPTCCFSFSYYFGGWNIAYDSHKNYAIACVVKASWGNNSVDISLIFGCLEVLFVHLATCVDPLAW